MLIDHFEKLSDFKMPTEAEILEEVRRYDDSATTENTEPIEDERNGIIDSVKAKEGIEPIETEKNIPVEESTLSEVNKPEEIAEDIGKSDGENKPININRKEKSDIIEKTKTLHKTRATLKDYPDDDKPREKMIAIGAENLSNAELMAIVIGSGTINMTAIELSRAILSQYDNRLDVFLQMSAEELSKDEWLKGIGFGKACKIIAAVELGRRARRSVQNLYEIKSPEDVADYLTDKMQYYDQEHFDVLLLDTKGRIFKHEKVTVGTINSSLVHAREVFSRAIRQHAFAVILAHNHPSGDPTPSAEDLKITNELISGGKILGIPVMDHVIIGDGCHVSLRAELYCSFDD